MTTSTSAFYFVRPNPDIGGMAPETPPGIIWGQGTPGAIEPFTIVNKGALYMQVDGTDDESHCWMKVDEGGDAADWVQLLTTPYNRAETLTATNYYGVKITYEPTMVTGGSYANGLFVDVVTAGSAGSGVQAISGRVIQGATKNVNGAIYAGKFELQLADLTTGSLPNHAVLRLIYRSEDTSLNNVAGHGFIQIEDVGSAGESCRNLFYFTSTTIATGASTTAIISTLSGGKETTCSHAVRFLVGTTPYWFLCTSTAPA